MATPFKSRSVPVGENGRMNLPADIRRSLGLNGAGKVIIEQDDSGVVRILTMEHRLAHIRALVAPYIKPGVSMVDELIRDRRAENAKDEAEMAEHDRRARG